MSTAVGIFIIVSFNTDAAKVAAAILMPSHWGKYTSLCVLQPTTVGKLGLFPSLVVGRVVQSVYRLQARWSGIESWWGQDFLPIQTGPGNHPASCTMGTGSFPGVKCSQAMLLATHPLLVPRSWKSRALPLPALWATPGL